MLNGKKYASKDRAVKQNVIICAHKCIFQSLSVKPRPAGLFIDLYCLRLAWKYIPQMETSRLLELAAKLRPSIGACDF